MNERYNPIEADEGNNAASSPEAYERDLNALKMKFAKLERKRATAKWSKDWTEADVVEWNRVKKQIEDSQNADEIQMRAELAELQQIIDGTRFEGGLTDAQRSRYIFLNQQLKTY